MATTDTRVKSFRGDLDFDVTIVRPQQQQRQQQPPGPIFSTVMHFVDFFRQIMGGEILKTHTVSTVIDISDHPDENSDTIEQVSFLPLIENQCHSSCAVSLTWHRR